MTQPAPVSVRVDRAWQRGYEAGLATKRDRLAIVAMAVSLFALWRRVDVRKRAALVPWALLAMLIALAVLVPMALVASAIRVSVHLIGTQRRRNARHRPPIVGHEPTEAVEYWHNYRVISTSWQRHTETRRYQDGGVRTVDTHTGDPVSDF